MFQRFTRTLAATASLAVIGLFAVPQVVHAATVDITVTDADGNAIPRAMVAVLNSDGDAIDSAIADATGKVSVDNSGAGLVVAAPGFGSKVVDSVSAGAIKLTASAKTKLSYSNAFGGQVRTVAGDADSGVFYATTDAQPSVWRTTDYAGTWSPVPTSVEDTEASASAAGAMTQSQAASEIFTSAAKGEVGVQVGSDLYFSRNYGTTWTKASGYSAINSQTKKHYWVHGGPAGDMSIIFVRTDNDLYAAVVPDSKNDSALPTFSSVKTAFTTAGAYAMGDNVAFAVGSTGDMFMMSVNGTAAKISQLDLAGPGVPDITVVGTTTIPGFTMGTTGTGLVKLSTQGGATPTAFAAHQVDGATVSLTVGYNDGTGWNMSSGIVGTNSSDSLSPWDVTSLSGKCGQNGNTPLVASIANDKPGAGEILEGVEVVGSIGQCEFLFNSVDPVSLGTQALAVDKVALLPMNGANNNTGFVWDSGYNFSDNLVAISGDGQFGVRKSADLSATTKYRPQFGAAGGTDATAFVTTQATSGKATTSGGIAVNGMTAPNVTDAVYDPNSTDGSKLVISTTETGGSRTLLSTDGGTSFSTLGAGGSRSLDWWNGASGVQHIAATFSLGSGFLQVKSFKTTSGTGKLDMGDELAATAAIRDSKDVSARKDFSFGQAVNPAGSTLSATSFVPGATQTLTSAIEGVAGKDMMLMSVNKCSGNVGPTGCETSAGSVALISLTVDATSGNDSIAGIKYFGSEVSASGANSVSGSGTYTAGVNAIQYCPTGSAAKVADTAFISVSGKGIYKISAVTTAPSHAATGTASGTYTEMKVDCDTGLIAVAGSTGVFMSIDGGAKFFELKTTAAPANNNNPGPQGQAPTAIALQADATSGDVTVAVGSGNGDVKSIETSFTNMGLKGSEVAAGTATPPASVTPTTDQIVEVNNSSTGKNTGAVPDLELPNQSTDKVAAASVKTYGVRAFATGVKLAIGTAGGAFKATVKSGATASGGTTTGGTTTGGATTGGTTTGGTTGAKTVTITVKKIVTVSSALKTLGVTVVAKSTIAATSTTKTICSVVSGTKVKGLKAGTCKLTVKITPPKTAKVPRPKATTKKISITIK